MKKALLYASFLFAGFSYSQDCSDLFISEYVEGRRNNKAIEVYNPTSSAVDLTNYFLVRYNNGSTSATVQGLARLQGTIQPYGTFVAVLDRRDNATSSDPLIWEELEAKGDAFYSSDYDANHTMRFNGDDVMVLLKGNIPQDLSTLSPSADISTLPLIPLDVIGKIGERPRNDAGGTASPTGGWSTGYPHNGNGNGVIVTVDHGLIRKADIKKGYFDLSAPVWNPLLQWDSIPAVVPRLDENGELIYNAAGNLVVDGNWASLGQHTCDCQTLSTGNIEDKQIFKIFPNPSTGVFTVEASSGIQAIVAYNSLGQVVKTISVNGVNTSFDLGKNAGVYLLEVKTGNGSRIERVIVK